MVCPRKRGPVSLFVVFLITVSLTGMSGCGGGLPENIKKTAESLSGDIQAAEGFIQDQRKKFQALTQAPAFAKVRPAADKENWAGWLTEADQTLARAKEIYDRDLGALLKKNRPESAGEVRQLTGQVKTILQDAEGLSKKPVERYTAIRDAMENMADYRRQARTDFDRIYRSIEQLNTGTVEKALADFPDNGSTIRSRFAPFLKIEQDAARQLEVVNTEFDRFAGNGEADFAVFTDSYAALRQTAGNIDKLAADAQTDFQQLYQSYTKVLKDMKIDYHVTVKRESWNENANFYDPRFFTYQREVPADVYEQVTADDIDTIAEITAGFMGSRLKNRIGDSWNRLNIDPTENWPGRSHNAAAFWIDDSKETFFHNYILEQNGETSETGWEQVDESVYEANLEYLGMAILSKPYGVFENDRLTEAAPPGMAYVGNPEYGEWRQDDSGNRFWSWYGRYAFFSNLFFFPPYYYGYRSWSGWRNDYRHKKPYFGTTSSGTRQFGTSGTLVKKSPVFQNTHFAKSGGFKTQAASVRGAASGLRGGGPKGKGK
jgi:ABC-type transporter Mla subunit MlaD